MTTHFRLAGGIGNQLFCLAAARYFAERTGHRVALNTWFLEHFGENHGTSLSGRGFPERFVRRKPVTGKGRTAFLDFLPNLRLAYQSVPNGGWDPQLEDVGRGAAVAGYFQTWRYAAALSDPISRRDLLLREGPSAWLRDEIDRAEQVRPVILHLRLGDYVKQASEFGLIGSNYVGKAVAYIRDAGIQNEIWTFSDDIPGARRILREAGIHTRTINPPPTADPAESLVLMSHGRANIISNSTFSWWGAFLNLDAELVLAPEPWFAGREAPAELIPPDWHQIMHSF